VVQVWLRRHPDLAEEEG